MNHIENSEFSTSNEAISIGQHLGDVLRTRPHGISNRLNSVALRYQKLVSSAVPKLSGQEWWALVSATVNTVLEHEVMLNAEALSLGIEDADRYEHLGSCCDIDAKALARRIRGLGQAEIAATIEILERVQSRIADGAGSGSFDDLSAMLRTMGIAFTD